MSAATWIADPPSPRFSNDGDESGNGGGSDGHHDNRHRHARVAGTAGARADAGNVAGAAACGRHHSSDNSVRSSG